MASYEVDQSAVVTHYLVTPVFADDAVNRLREQGDNGAAVFAGPSASGSPP